METIGFYREVARRLAAGERLAMATVVETRGSAPRQAGAKMAVTAAGGAIGTVGGGYPEHETTRVALAVIEEGKPRMLHLELTADVADRMGATCGGVMDVFVEPLGAALAP
ncbi:MAG: XdhC family protein [Anaerolineae bacterium]